MILKTHKQKAEIAEKILNSKGPVLLECLFDCGTRSGSQNASLHLFCDLLAKAFNAAGYTVQYVLAKFKKEIPWSKDGVKDNVWRPMQIALTGKESTTQLNKLEPSDIYEHVNRFTSTELGVHVPWPCIETMREE